MTAANKRDPWFRNRLIRDGLYRALHEQMTVRPEIVILGEGSHMKIHFDSPAIEKDFPGRVLTMPISEDGNTNFAVGLALRGMTPVVDVISSDFLFRTMDAICNTAAKVNYVRDPPLTIVIRAEFLTGGPTTGQRIEEMFCHVPGLRVGVPSNPLDACWMMHSALQHKGVTILFEDRMIEDSTTPSDRKLESRQVFEGPNGARIRSRPGSKVTIASYGQTFRQCETLFGEDSRVELVDLRWLAPLDMTTVYRSASMAGALLIVEPGAWKYGIGAEIKASLGEFETDMRIWVKRVGAPRATIPAARELHDRLLPTDGELRDAVDMLARGPR